MKRLLCSLLLVSLGAAPACGGRRPPEKFAQKLVILGFDGMDPRLVQRWMDEGKLPNMRKLAAKGGGFRFFSKKTVRARLDDKAIDVLGLDHAAQPVFCFNQKFFNGSPSLPRASQHGF